MKCVSLSLALGALIVAPSAMLAQNQIAPAAPAAANLSSPIGVAAAAPSTLLYTSGLCGAHTVQQVSLSTGASSLFATMPAVPAINNECGAGLQGAEDAIAISPGLGSFAGHAGDVYVTQANDIYKIPAGGGAPALFTSIPGLSTQGHSGITFDAIGTFGLRLIVSGEGGVYAIDASATSTQLAGGAVSSTGHPLLFESLSVAPLTFGTYKGYLFITGEDDSNATGGGGNQLFVLAPNSGTTASAAPPTGVSQPALSALALEGVTFPVCSLTVPAGSPSHGSYNAFLTVFSKTRAGDLSSTDGAILGYGVPAGDALIIGEYGLFNGTNNSFGLNTGSYQNVNFMNSTGSLAPSQVVTQLEAVNNVACLPGTGCPATQGFWHKASHWPTVSGSVDGISYDASTQTLTIGGISYSQSELLNILPSGSLHTGGYVNALSQFIAAALNLIAGGKHSTIDSTIIAINNALIGVTFTNGTSLSVPSNIQTLLNNSETALNNYNSAVGLGCSEASGLNVGN